MATPFIGEIKIVAFNFPPKGWAMCNGQTLAINQNQALFSILGTTYGGNGVTTFALPNFQGCAPMHQSNNHVLGERAGLSAVTLAFSEMPSHTHAVNGNSSPGTTPDPSGASWAKESANATFIYSNSLPGGTLMAPQAIGNTGGNQPHSNMQPYLVLTFVIALVGVFPSRN
jgi:microcystin-dependent protein